MQFFCYHNGLFFEQKEAFISVTHLGFTRGYMAFELFRVYDRIPFCLDLHLSRLKENAKALFLEYPNNLDEIIEEVLQKNLCPNMVLRIYLSEDESGKMDLLILCDAVVVPTKEQYEKGIAVITSSLPRIFHRVKSSCYISAMMALKEAKKKNAEDAVFKDAAGYLLEGTRSNFFAVLGGVLYTAKNEILLGITRSIVIDVAKTLSIPVIEEPILESSLDQVEEAFLTSSSREILPICQIDKTSIPLGPITKLLHTHFPKPSLQLLNS